MNYAFFFIFLWATASLKAEVPVPESFQDGVAAFERGDFAKAETIFSKLTATTKSAALFYNLGNTEWRLQKPGEAVLWLRRAVLLEPDFAEAKQNLSFLKGKLGLTDPPVSHWRGLIYGVSREFWLLTGIGGFWLLVVSVLAGLHARQGGWRVVCILVSVGMGIVSSVAITCWWLKRDAGGTVHEFIVAKNTPVLGRAAATVASECVAEFPPGTLVSVAKLCGPWIYAKLPGEKRGWLRRDELEPLWPWEADGVP